MGVIRVETKQLSCCFTGAGNLLRMWGGHSVTTSEPVVCELQQCGVPVAEYQLLLKAHAEIRVLVMIMRRSPFKLMLGH